MDGRLKDGWTEMDGWILFTRRNTLINTLRRGSKQFSLLSPAPPISGAVSVCEAAAASSCQLQNKVFLGWRGGVVETLSPHGLCESIRE